MSKHITTDQALTYLRSRLEVNGCAAVKVEDGEIFAFSKAKVLELLKLMEEKGKDEVIVFVKTDPNGLTEN